MPVRIGINGMGRIGRCLFRLTASTKDVVVCAVNDVAPPGTLAHLLKHDSISGAWSEPVEGREGEIRVRDRALPCTGFASPDRIPWADHGTEIVVEATGRFRSRAQAAGHLRGGARSVIISAPSEDADFTVGWGVNEDRLDPARHRIVSNASCTTQCAAPLLQLIDSEWGIQAGSMTTVHCVTNDQPLMDAPHRDLRRSRAGGMSMIPTTTSAALALGQILPGLAERLTCLAVRVPTPFVSAVELVTALKRPAETERTVEMFREAARGRFAGLVGVAEEELVSVDFRGDPRSAVVDAKLTALPTPALLRLFAWYDNESGYTHRLLDLVRRLGAGGAS